MSKKNKIKKQFKTENVRVFKQFQKQRIFKQISFVMASLVMAFGINSFVLNGDLGQQLKTNILETNKNLEKKANIYIEKNKNISTIKISNKMSQVKSLSFSLTYNPESIKLQDIVSKIQNAKLLKIENEPGITTLIINFENPQDINSGNNILDLYISKKISKTTQNINLINANFTDSSNVKYDLTTSGITF